MIDIIGTHRTRVQSARDMLLINKSLNILLYLDFDLFAIVLHACFIFV